MNPERPFRLNLTLLKATFISACLLSVFCGCSRHSNQEDDRMPPLYPDPVTVRLDTVEGYKINRVTGDSIKPIILSSGDTLISGKTVPVRQEKVSMMGKYVPWVLPAEQPLKNKAYSNKFRIPEKLNRIALNIDSLARITYDPTARSTILNSTGDTIITGKPLPFEGTIVNFIQPRPVPALLPRMVDNATKNIHYLDVDQGLSSSVISCILEDRTGNIWIGTAGGGISVYNGVNFSNLTYDEGLGNNNINEILQDREGNIWIATRSGIIKYDGSKYMKFTEKEGLINNNVWCLTEDSKGNLWIGTYGSGISRFDGEKITHYSVNEGLSNNIIYDILEDRNGNIWVATWGGGANYFDGNSFLHLLNKDGMCSNFLVDIIEDHSGNIWFASPDSVCMYDGTYLTSFTKREGLSSDYVFSMMEDSKHNIWFCTNGGGATKFDGTFFTHYTGREGLSSSYVTISMEDSNGNYWLGTNGGGLNIIYSKEFSHLTEADGLSHNVVFTVFEDSHENLWFGTRGGGVDKFDGKNFYVYTEDEGLQNNYVLSIGEDTKGDMWFGSYGAGVIKFDGKTFTSMSTYQGLSDYTVNKILEDNHGNMWFGTYRGGVTRFDGNGFHTYSESIGLGKTFIFVMKQDIEGNLWFGNDFGITLLSGDKAFLYTAKEGLPAGSVTTMYIDSKGNYWFGTSFGLSVFDGQYFTTFTEDQGLSDNGIKTIQEDQSGNIWVSTINGLNCLVFQDSGTITNKNGNIIRKPLVLSYDKRDGLNGTYFFHSSLIDSKNQLWNGTAKSLTCLDLNSFRIPVDTPRIQLDRIDINGNFVDYRNFQDSLWRGVKFVEVAEFTNYPEKLQLPFKYKHLTFHFSGIDWSAPHKILYSYKIEGVDDTWSIPSSEAKADYRNLPYGYHTFKVRTIGESQRWSEPFEYSFRILPPWYNTWLARIGYVVILMLIIYIAVRWRTASLKHRQKELEEEVDHATRKIREQKEEVEAQKDEIEAQRDQLQEQRDLVLSQKQEITDSINYAKRIQSAVLPDRKHMDQSLPDYFILYRPRDIVSGDFYWIKEVKNFVIVVVGDCTGHGVPGAFMSMLGISLLNEQVGRSRFDEPGEILDRLRKKVKQTLAQEGKEHEQKDGIDMALAMLNRDTRELQFAGAFNPIYIVREKKKTKKSDLEEYAALDTEKYQLYEVKGDRQPISIHETETKFTTLKFQMAEEDTFYLFSDGFSDQIGGTLGKKFLTRNFKKTILELQNIKMEEQGNSLASTLDTWMTGYEQIDDITVMGIKVK